MALRVVAGIAGGRKLVAPKGGARPTKDRVKEALFSSLGGAVVDAAVLDLYAGSGALAIEALSRGAACAVLVDDDRAAEAAIRANLDTTGFAAQARLVKRTVEAFVTGYTRGSAPEGPFDLVFVDPPYVTRADDVGKVLTGLVAAGALAPGATVVIERAKGSEAVPLPPGWDVPRERTYGDTLLVVATA
jgi:16S rRNA (guanine966-N2)-methyltransferase